VFLLIDSMPSSSGPSDCCGEEVDTFEQQKFGVPSETPAGADLFDEALRRGRVQMMWCARRHR